MKTSQLFWGILFLTLGSLILVNNIADLNFDWYFIWNLWPLILVVLGIYFFVKGSSYRWIVVVVISLVLGLMIFAAYKSITGFFYYSDDESMEVELYEVPYSEGVKKAFLNVDAAAGRIQLKDTTQHLVSISKKGNFGEYIFSNDLEDDQANVSLEMEEEQHFRFGKGFMKTLVNMELNIRPAWNMEFNAGAASINLDLTPYIVERAAFKTGATSIDVKVGDKSDYTRLEVESGVSKIRIKVPKTSGCEIDSQTEFARKQFDGFTKIDNETYRTPGYEDAVKKVMISLNADISNIIVDRY